MSVAPTRPSATGIPGADELVGRARALAPKLRERAVKAERDRNIPQELVDEYIAAGLIHTLQPKRWGGYEHDHEVAFDIAIELGKSTCGSSAWCLNYLGDHACILAHFPEEAQHEVWSRTRPPASPPRRRRRAKRRWRPAATASTAAGRGAAGCAIRNGS